MIVVGVVVVIFVLITAIWEMNKILEAENENILLGHIGISLIREGRLLTIWFWRITIFSFFLLYIGNGHLFTELLLVIVTLMTISAIKNLGNRVKEILRNIDQAVAE